MKTLTDRIAVFLAMALIAASFASCADVHPNARPGTLVGQTDAADSQAADAQPQSATNIPF